MVETLKPTFVRTLRYGRSVTWAGPATVLPSSLYLPDGMFVGLFSPAWCGRLMSFCSALLPEALSRCSHLLEYWMRTGDSEWSSLRGKTRCRDSPRHGTPRVRMSFLSCVRDLMKVSKLLPPAGLFSKPVTVVRLLH